MPEFIAEAGRLDVFVAARMDITRSQAERRIRGECVRVNEVIITKPGRALKGGERIDVKTPKLKEITAKPQDIDIKIVYQDADLAVINKPRGLVVHPAPGHADGTLVNALMHHLSDLSGIGGNLRPGIVHRLDRDTTGLLMVAKNDFAHNALAGMIQSRAVQRIYRGIVEGVVKTDAGTIDAPIGRHPKDRKKMAVTKDGRPAITHYETLWRYKNASFMQFKLDTGRTHQIRVHMAHIHHPILCDPVYASCAPRFKDAQGQLLHAYRLEFTHPRTGEDMSFCADLPDDFMRYLDILRAQSAF